MIGEPSALRDSRRMNTPRSLVRGTSFSMPTDAMCSFGVLAERSALPSLVQVTTAARFGDDEIAAGHAGVGGEDQRPRVLALSLREVVRIVVAGLRSDRAGEDVGDVGAQLVHRGHDDMARRFLVELLDALAEVGLGDLDAVLSRGIRASRIPR